MPVKFRFILIGVGIVLFLILAPLAIFFARGFRVDLASGKITKTGALVVKSDPKGAEVFLDGKRLKKTPLTKRFVFPEDYELSVRKSGYQSWEKNISIHPQLITNPAQKGKEEIFLFFDTPTEKSIATNTVDFLFAENELVFLNSGFEIFTADKTGNKNTLFASISAELSNPKIAEKSGDYALIRDGSRYFLAAPEQTWELPDSLRNVTLAGERGKVLGIDGEQSLVEHDVDSKTDGVLEKQVDGFKKIGKDIYYLRDNSLVQLSVGAQETVIAESLPNFESSEIIVTADRQLFLLLDGSLYIVNQDLEKINQNVAYAVWSEGSRALIYGNENEAWLFTQQREQRNELLARNSGGVSAPRYNSATGYFLLAEGSTIKAVETSFDGQANVFILGKTKNKGAEFEMDENGEYLIVKDGANLSSLKVR